jgi:antitoxin ParD1/3/4
MNIELPPDQQAFLSELVATGRFASIGDAIRESVALLISHEDLKRQIKLGVEQADRNEVIEHDAVFQQLRTLIGATSDSAGQ